MSDVVPSYSRSFECSVCMEGLDMPPSTIPGAAPSAAEVREEMEVRQALAGASDDVNGGASAEAGHDRQPPQEAGPSSGSRNVGQSEGTAGSQSGDRGRGGIGPTRGLPGVSRGGVSRGGPRGVFIGGPGSVFIAGPAGVFIGGPGGVSRGGPGGVSRGGPGGVFRGGPGGVSRGGPGGVSRGGPGGVSRGAPGGVSRGAPGGISTGGPCGVSRGAPGGVCRGGPGGVCRGGQGGVCGGGRGLQGCRGRGVSRGVARPVQVAASPASAVVVVTSCGHAFHQTCVVTWFTQKGKRVCPYCQELLPPKSLRRLFLPVPALQRQSASSAVAPKEQGSSSGSVQSQCAQCYETSRDLDKTKAENAELIFQNDLKQGTINSLVMQVTSLECNISVMSLESDETNRKRSRRM